MPPKCARFTENVGFSCEKWMKEGLRRLYESKGGREGEEMRQALRMYLSANGIFPPGTENNESESQ